MGGHISASVQGFPAHIMAAIFTQVFWPVCVGEHLYFTDSALSYEYQQAEWRLIVATTSIYITNNTGRSPKSWNKLGDGNPYEKTCTCVVNLFKSGV